MASFHQTTIISSMSSFIFSDDLFSSSASYKEGGKYLFFFLSLLRSRKDSYPKVSDCREAHAVRNPTAPLLLLQVALGSLGNLVGGGSGAPKTQLVRAELASGATEETCGGKGQHGQPLFYSMYPFTFLRPKVLALCFCYCVNRRFASVLFNMIFDVVE